MPKKGYRLPSITMKIILRVTCISHLPCYDFIPGKNNTVLKTQGVSKERTNGSCLVGIHNAHLGGIFADCYDDDYVCESERGVCVCMHLEQPKYLRVSSSLLI